MFNGISFIFTQCDTNKSDQCSLWAEKKKSQYYKTKLCKINWMFASGHRIFQYLFSFSFFISIVI